MNHHDIGRVVKDGYSMTWGTLDCMQGGEVFTIIDQNGNWLHKMLMDRNNNILLFKAT